jgi:hypothetical protein
LSAPPIALAPRLGHNGRLPGDLPVKPPPAKTRLSDLKGAPPKSVFEPPTPKVSRQKRGKVLTPAERAAFLAARPDLKP